MFFVLFQVLLLATVYSSASAMQSYGSWLSSAIAASSKLTPTRAADAAAPPLHVVCSGEWLVRVAFYQMSVRHQDALLECWLVDAASAQKQTAAKTALVARAGQILDNMTRLHGDGATIRVVCGKHSLFDDLQAAATAVGRAHAAQRDVSSVVRRAAAQAGINIDDVSKFGFALGALKERATPMRRSECCLYVWFFILMSFLLLLIMLLIN